MAIDMNRENYRALFTLIHRNPDPFRGVCLYVRAHTVQHVRDLMNHRVYKESPLVLHVDLSRDVMGEPETNLLLEDVRQVTNTTLPPVAPLAQPCVPFQTNRLYACSSPLRTPIQYGR